MHIRFLNFYKLEKNPSTKSEETKPPEETPKEESGKNKKKGKKKGTNLAEKRVDLNLN